MTKYQVNVEIQYDDCVVVEADSEEEAAKLGEEKACGNVGVFCSINAKVLSVEVSDGSCED